MFRDCGAGGRGDEGGGGGDVDRVRTVAARAGRVDQVVTLWLDGQDVGAHRLGAASDLRGRFPLRAQGDEEAANLRGRRFAAHDLSHHLARLPAAEVVAVEQLL